MLFDNRLLGGPINVFLLHSTYFVVNVVAVDVNKYDRNKDKNEITSYLAMDVRSLKSMNMFSYVEDAQL